MTIFHLLIFMTLCLSLSSCASKEKNTSTYLDHVPKSLKYFKNIVPNQIQIGQFVTFKNKERSQSLQVYFTHDSSLKINILTPEGVEIFGKNGLENEDSYSLLTLEQKNFLTISMLSDMAFTYGNERTLKEMGFQGITIIENQKSRKIKYHDQLIANIKYTKKSKWDSEIDYKNHFFNYTLKIKPIIKKAL